MRELICRLFGHKDYEVCGGVRCRRCGRGIMTNCITKEALQVLRANMGITSKRLLAAQQYASAYRTQQITGMPKRRSWFEKWTRR